MEFLVWLRRKLKCAHTPFLDFLAKAEQFFERTPEEQVWEIWTEYLGEVHGASSPADQEGRWEGDSCFEYNGAPAGWIRICELSAISLFLLREYAPSCPLHEEVLLYRGTQELWEKAAIEALLPPPTVTLIRGGYLTKAARWQPQLEGLMRRRIRQYPCSVLRSGKEVVMGHLPAPLETLSAQAINQEVCKRVGHETFLGTPNLQSHFVPCGTYTGISQGFGHGSYYRFKIQGRFYGRTKAEIQRYVLERPFLPRYVVPLFRGGNNEVLAYTGALITSVELVQGGSVRTVLNSLD